jgi:hypothetical protein
MRRGDFWELLCEPLFRVPKIISLLHSQPKAWAIAAKFAESHSHVRGYACIANKDAVQRLSRDPQLSRRFAYRNLQSRKHILSEHFAGG